MASKKAIQDAVSKGKEYAKQAIAVRDGKLKNRARVLKKLPKAKAQVGKDLLLMPMATSAATSRGTIVAEGDSWFDYPLHDVLKILDDDYGYDIESVAHKGDRVEDMAYGEGQLITFLSRIEKLARNGVTPSAILLSGGGNDLAGDEFGMLLNHQESPIAGLNDSIITGVIDERLHVAYATILSKVTAACQSRLGKAIPIVIHGYDYAIADGRGFMGGWGPLPGPWLEPGFREKGYSLIQRRIDLTKTLIDRFNNMLKKIPEIKGFDHVHHLDLRGTLSSATANGKYKNDWGNELHPTGDGFQKVTKKFADLLQSFE